MSRQAPFRAQALQHYTRQSAPTVLPQFVSWRTTALLWGLLVACVGAAGIFWLLPIPSYVTVSGIVQAQPNAGIVLFLPASQAAEVHQGTLVQIQLGENGPQFSAQVATIETEVLSPAAARQSYGLGSAAWGVVTEPSLALLVPLEATVSATTYAGSVVTAQVQAGTSSALHLLPGLDSLTGGSNG